MATPNYLGQGQPPASSGGLMSGIFGDNTPAYAGAAAAAPSAPRARSILGFGYVAPAYKVASTSPSLSADCDPSGSPQIAFVMPIDPQT
jgi:hypothetical protein